MYSRSQLSCLFRQVGLRQVNNPSLEPYSSELTQSDSGIYLDGIHPLLNEDNIDCIVPFTDHYEFPPYNAGSTYSQGDIVKDGELFYESLVDANTGNPTSDGNFWSRKLYKSEYIKSKFEESDNILINRILTKKKLALDTKSIFSDLKLFNSEASLARVETKRNRMVGFEITLRRSEGVRLTIDRIGTLLTQGQTLEVKLFHSSQESAIDTFNITATGNEFTWTSITNAILSYEAPDAGGSFYLLYKESDLVGQAARKDINVTNVCKCTPNDYTVFKKYSKHAIISSVSFEDESETLPDLTRRQYHYNTTFGLNLSFQVGCDVSSILCRNVDILSNAIAYHRAYTILREMAFTTRDNSLSDEVKNLATGAILGNENMMGLEKLLENEIEALNFDLSALNSECLPCKTNSRVKHRVA